MKSRLAVAVICVLVVATLIPVGITAYRLAVDALDDDSPLAQIEPERTAFGRLLGPTSMPPDWKLTQAVVYSPSAPGCCVLYTFSNRGARGPGEVKMCLSSTPDRACGIGPPEVNDPFHTVNTHQRQVNIDGIGRVHVTLSGIGADDFALWQGIEITGDSARTEAVLRTFVD